MLAVGQTTNTICLNSTRQNKMQKLQCSKCKTLTNNHTPSQLKRNSSRICRNCLNKTKKQKNNTLFKTMLNNREIMTFTSIDKEIQKHLQLNPQHVNITYNAQYIDANKVKQHIDVNIPTAIQSVMGTGKTKYVIEIIKQAKQLNKTVIYICPNISTIEDTEQQLNEQGIKTVRYNETQYFNNLPNVVLSTVDSCEVYLDRDVLIVDEVYTVFEEMAFKTVINNTVQNNLLAKYHKIMRHKKVFVLDRYINPVLKLFDIFQRDFRGCVTEFKIIQNTYKKKKDINLLTYDKQVKVKKEIKTLLRQYNDENLTVHFSEERSAKKFYDELVKEFNNVGLYTAHVKDDIKNLQIKITTSSLSRGYSLSGDSTYLIDSGRTVGVMTLLQMLDRARNSKVVNLYLKDGTTKNETLNVLYNKYKQLEGYDLNLRIREFLRMVKKMENEHKEVLKFMVIDTYDVGKHVSNIYDLMFVNDLIDSNWDRWYYEKTDIKMIISGIKSKVDVTENEILNALTVKRLIKR